MFFCFEILVVKYFDRLFLLLSFKLFEPDVLSVYLYVYHMELYVFTAPMQPLGLYLCTFSKL